MASKACAGISSRWRRPNLSCRCAIGDFTDFFASIFHATNAGRAVPPRQPAAAELQIRARRLSRPRLLGRASGTAVQAPARPAQRRRTRRRRATARRAISISSSSSASTSARRATLGETVPVGKAADAHFRLLPAQRLVGARHPGAGNTSRSGPFLGKNFATTVSPWVVTQEALAPFRVAGVCAAAGDPAPLPYLDDADDQAHGGLDITLEAYLATEAMRRAGTAPLRLTQTSFATMYWTVAQMVAHHTCNGCNLVTGDLIGSGTVSGPEKIELGQPARTHRARPRADRIAERREARLHRGRRRDHLPRLLRQGTAMPRIGFGECRGRGVAGGVDAASSHSTGTHFCRRLPVSTSPV